VMNDPLTPPKDRLVAARDLLDRAGYKPVDKIQADVDAEISFKVSLPEGLGDADD